MLMRPEEVARICGDEGKIGLKKSTACRKGQLLVGFQACWLIMVGAWIFRVQSKGSVHAGKMQMRTGQLTGELGLACLLQALRWFTPKQTAAEVGEINVMLSRWSPAFLAEAFQGSIWPPRLFEMLPAHTCKSVCLQVFFRRLPRPRLPQSRIFSKAVIAHST